ncbi:MAG: DUF4126 domain-containing protein [Proteobacteria bacterium]|nr:DUF4126 domain-containing protein [Pseudomonadota bacterium]
MSDTLTVITSICLGIALAAATGMRIFLPLLLAGLAIRFEMFSISPETISGHGWLASVPALLCFGVATVIEALAYKMPYIDHLLDVIGAPAALIAGSVLATSFIVGIDDPLLKYGLGIVSGAGSAGVVHGATAIARVVSTKTTGGLGNPLFAVGELIGAFITSVLAFLAPLFGIFLVLTAIFVILYAFRKLIGLNQPSDI